MTNTSLEEQVYRAFVFGLPSYEFARTRYNDLTGAGNQSPLASNALRHGRSLSGAGDRWITTPNNDTLYSRAWLDLSRGAVSVTVGAQPRGRYWSVALMDARTRNFALLGQRLHGEGPAQITLVGPEGDPTGIEGYSVRAPSNDVWLLARWIVEGPHDLGEARAMQDRLALQAQASFAPQTTFEVVPTSAADPQNFLAVLAEQLARNPVSGPDAEWAERLASVGVRAGAKSPWSELSHDVRNAWTSSMEACQKRLCQRFISRRRQVGGWWVSEDQLDDASAGGEWLAGIALSGLGALDSSEAVYATRMADDDGDPLDGRHRYTLTVPPAGIPSGSFWSISLYELMPDGRRFFVQNDLGRHSIGDRTPNLRYASDGSLTVILQHATPEQHESRANWLPLPATAFALTLRAYHPSTALRQWEIELPKLELIG